MIFRCKFNIRGKFFEVIGLERPRSNVKNWIWQNLSGQLSQYLVQIDFWHWIRSFHAKYQNKHAPYIVLSSVADPEPGAGAATFREAPELEPEPHFLRRLRLHLLGRQKRKALFLCPGLPEPEPPLLAKAWAGAVFLVPLRLRLLLLLLLLLLLTGL